MLIFVGSAVVSVHGLPRDVLVATDKELDRLLIAGGARITAATAKRIAAIAAEVRREAEGAPWRERP
ncbi:hypothetical protein [Paractinoplanes durhamensis]|uniref:Uncharacterized protein n=1 Tax=Paractinoplanes durhamensis TaxID=113563 RepID=A0ABQ3YNL4_9ACTN|nr:hypothetical protein [Actinoplanes durhamensis]GID99174.1 hypothetical protein Adu01nite_05250 [Actinoplanes durhamensis]